MQEFNYPLETPFQYAKGGQMTDAEFITCTAPTSKMMRVCAELRQAFFRAAASNADDSESRDPSEADIDAIQGSEVLIAIANSTVVELADVMENAKKLLSSGVAMIDGEVKLTGTIIDKMSIDDFDELAGQYLVNFIVASSLRKVKSKLSEAS